MKKGKMKKSHNYCITNFNFARCTHQCPSLHRRQSFSLREIRDNSLIGFGLQWVGSGRELGSYSFFTKKQMSPSFA